MLPARSREHPFLLQAIDPPPDQFDPSGIDAMTRQRRHARGIEIAHALPQHASFLAATGDDGRIGDAEVSSLGWLVERVRCV